MNDSDRYLARWPYGGGLGLGLAAIALALLVSAGLNNPAAIGKPVGATRPKPRVSFSPEFGVLLSKSLPSPNVGASGLAEYRGFIWAQLYEPAGNIRKKPLRLLEREAHAGSRKAMVTLGALSLGDGEAAQVSGRSGAPAFAEARRWLAEAARRGSTRADVTLGAMDIEGVGIPRSYPRAVARLRGAARLGDTHAMALLAVAYYLDGGPKSTARGNHWLKRALARDDADAMVVAGFGYLLGASGHPESAKGVDLAHHLPLGQTADGGIATHAADGGGVHGDQGDAAGAGEQFCPRPCRLRPGVPTADHNQIKIQLDTHICPGHSFTRWS